jgi:hypothetical protein
VHAVCGSASRPRATHASRPVQHRLPLLLRPLLDGPVGTEEPVLPVALVLNKALWKKLAVVALIAVAETVVTSSVKGRKPK